LPSPGGGLYNDQVPRSLPPVAVALAALVALPGLAAGGLVGCGSSSQASTSTRAGVDRDAGIDASLTVGTADASPTTTAPGGAFGEWLRARLPPGGSVVDRNGKVGVVHKVAPDDTPISIAKAYLDLTDVYFASELAKEITVTAGQSIEIPHLVSEPYKEPDADRLGWPEDKGLRGVFITGSNAAVEWPKTIDHVSKRLPAINAIVLDGKDYEGPITYPTKVKVALDMGASTAPWPKKEPPIPDLKRAIRFAHAKGVRVIMRIACFHDPWAAKHAPNLSVMATYGKPFTMGWMDPVNVEAQNYVIELAKEQIDAGADEIQLDYIRFPVHGGLKNAIFPPGNSGKRINAIRDFVRRVHEVTKARKVPLSLDIFGVVATGERTDMEMLGQDIAVLGHECEALSPMVYPSHYDAGYRGFEVPGNHAEIVGIGTRMAVDHLKQGKVKSCVIRSWLQASAYKTPVYGPKYLVDEAKSAESNGGAGWLMWSPSNDYNAAWQGFPPTQK
jgi:hypothetical protein